MKLRNKKTGEIGKILKQLSEDNQLEVITDTKLYVVKTIAELNEDWEDYEESKRYFIDCDGEVYEHARLNDFELDRVSNIGNLFETKEEAKQAVEKLKAWKRLKDKGFRFKGGNDGCIEYETDITNWSMQEYQDFNTLFWE